MYTMAMDVYFEVEPELNYSWRGCLANTSYLQDRLLVGDVAHVARFTAAAITANTADMT